MNFHWIDIGTCSVRVSNVELNYHNLATQICSKVDNRISSKQVKFKIIGLMFNDTGTCPTSAPDTSLCPSSVPTTSSSVFPSRSFVTTSLLYGSVSVPSSTNNDLPQTLVPSSTLDVFSFFGLLSSSSNYPSTSIQPSTSIAPTLSQYSSLQASQLYSDGSVSVSLVPSSSNSDLSQTESSATISSANTSQFSPSAFQTSSIIAFVPSSALNVISFFGSLSSSSNYPSTSIQPSTSVAPTLHTSEFYSDGSVSVPSLTNNDLSQTESSATSPYASVSTGFQTSSILVVPSSTLDVFSFFRSLTSSKYPSTFIQPSASTTPTSSHYSSISILTISFPSVSVLPPSPPSLYCAADEQWPETAAGYTANGTCYKGTVNATRYCNETGEWNETICHNSESFGAILSLVRHENFITPESSHKSITADK
uniref:Uncharacterized protein n=1 Tax=Amphimedon queenslandica TaxID=400682 RepID=A0A1X7SLG8_AMPQE